MVLFEVNMSCVRPIITFYGCVHVVCVAYTRPGVLATRLPAPEHTYRPYGSPPGARVPLHLVTTRRLWDAFGTTESFWSAVFCFAQLVYIITTTYKSMRTCAARVYPASGPFWARDGRYSISSAVTAGDDEASPGRVWDHKKL